MINNKLFGQFANYYGREELWPELEEIRVGDDKIAEITERIKHYVDCCIANEIDEHSPEGQQLYIGLSKKWIELLFNELVRRTRQMKGLPVPDEEE